MNTKVAVVKDKAKKVRDKAVGLASMAATAALMAPVYAASNDSGGLDIKTVTIKEGQGNNIKGMIGTAMGVFLLIAQYVGMGLTIFGLIQLIMAMKNDEPESKQRAIMTLVAGIALFGIESILSTFFNIN